MKRPLLNIALQVLLLTLSAVQQNINGSKLEQTIDPALSSTILYWIIAPVSGKAICRSSYGSRLRFFHLASVPGGGYEML